MQEFQSFLDAIDDPDRRARTQEVLAWVSDRFPELQRRIAWSQPMFTHHGTYIAGFSVSKKHLGLGLENRTVDLLRDRIAAAGYRHTKMVIQLPWDQPMDYDFIEDVIRFNINDKQDINSFWHPGDE